MWVAFLVANNKSRVSQAFGLAVTGISDQHGLAALDEDIFALLGGRLIRQLLVLSHQGFGDAAAGGVNLGQETTALYVHMCDHATRVVACCAEADSDPDGR